MKSLVLSIVFCCLASNVHSAAYKECSSFPNSNIEDDVKVSRCKSNYCPLKKGTKTQLEIKFVPDAEVKELFNEVTAGLGDFNLPFIGVDGASANKYVYNEDGETPATFPLEAGKKYVYKNTIDVLRLYPSVHVNVHWGLRRSDKSMVACFEVPARIVD